VGTAFSTELGVSQLVPLAVIAVTFIPRSGVLQNATHATDTLVAYSILDREIPTEVDHNLGRIRTDDAVFPVWLK
jgi:hypothetical protein